MSHIYALRTPDGDDVGQVDLAEIVAVGDEIRGSRNRPMRVQAVVLRKRISEFLDKPRYGLLIVEPID
jgi:hypothetical protein